MNKILIAAVVLVVLVVSAGGAAYYFYRDKFSEPPKQTAIKPKHNKPFNPDIVMTVGDKKFDMKLADNETTRALFTQLPFTLKMEDHLANEKFAASPEDLPANHTKPKRVEVRLSWKKSLLLLKTQLPAVRNSPSCAVYGQKKRLLSSEKKELKASLLMP